MPISRSAAAIACVAALAAACTDATPIAPRPVTPIRADLTTPSRPAPHPNSVKYRDAGFHPATGRSGSAVVSARALLGKSGRTDVEVTTGTFDAGPTPGVLSKVQIKAFGPSGALSFTNNYGGTTNTASYPYTTLPHGTAVQVQSAVTGTGDLRADIVTVGTHVYLRPDLVAEQLQGPNGAPTGAAVNFAGLISERNGEVGARADCVLFVNGAEADRAAGIWVDASGEVVCSMTHVFADVGTYALELRLENVSPGDFDDSNNRVTASIEVTAPGDFAFYTMQAWDIQDNGWWHSVSTLLDADGNLETWDQIYTRSGREENASINGLIPRELDYTAPITISGAMSSNGTTVSTVSDTYGPLPFVDWQGGYCDYQYHFDTRAVTYICVYPNTGYTYVQYDWSGAAIHYTSDSYVYYWDPNGEFHQAWYSDAYDDIGTLYTFGPDFSAQLSVQGANDPAPFTTQATVPFGPVDLHFDYVDPSCSTSPAPPGCFELHAHTYGQTGFWSYASWPPGVP